MNEYNGVEPGERILLTSEVAVNFYWSPTNKTASVISVVGRRDYEDIIKTGKVWEQIIEKIAERNNVRFVRYFHGYRFIQRKGFLEEDDSLKTEMNRIITAQKIRLCS